MGKIDAPIIETVGLEYEFTQIPLRAAQEFAPSGWNVVRDGSCTTNALVFGDTPVEEVSDSLRMFTREEQVGGEFVSPTFNMELDYNRYVEELIRIIDELLRRHEHITDLTGIHVHVCVGDPPAYVLKNLLMLWERLEAFIYRISVAEHRQHRGATHNDYMYCRPITGEGPQYVRDGAGYWRRCFDLDKILDKARTTKEILQAFGRADFQPSKWIPARYYGLNIVPILIFGTVEFRVFNQTMIPSYIKAWVEFCQAMVRLSYMDARISRFPPFPLGATHPVSTDGFTFSDIFKYIPESLITDGSWVVLEKLYEMTTWQPGCGPQINHLARSRDRTVPLDALSQHLRPETVSKEFIESIWSNGFED